MKKVEKKIVKPITNSCGSQGCEVVYILPYCILKAA